MPRVLVVDDDANARRLMQAFLAPDGYDLALVADGESALADVAEQRPDVVLLDLNLPGIDGFGVLERLKEDDWTAIVPVVVVTAAGDQQRRLRAVELGAADFLTKPVDRSELRLRVRSWLRLKEHLDEVRRMHDALAAIGRGLESRDPGLTGHCQRVADLCLRMGRAMGLGEADLRALQAAASLHDLGNVRVPETILRKAGPLADDERALVRTHPVAGDELLRSLTGLDLARTIVRHHHEHLDGSGYPDGLAGETIPLAVRIFSVADVFDTLTRERPWRHAFPVAEALAVLDAEAAEGLWDPAVVGCLKDVLAG